MAMKPTTKLKVRIDPQTHVIILKWKGEKSQKQFVADAVELVKIIKEEKFWKIADAFEQKIGVVRRQANDLQTLLVEHFNVKKA